MTTSEKLLLGFLTLNNCVYVGMSMSMSECLCLCRCLFRNVYVYVDVGMSSVFCS